MKTINNYYYFDSNSSHAAYEIGIQLTELMLKSNQPLDDIVILCIGTDRSTGDSLGPIIGYKLQINGIHNENVTVYGTLDKPVHATNLVDTMTVIRRKHSHPYIIAIDASVGHMDHVGFITIGTGPLRPGLGVNKNLPGVGNLHITGIVNVSGCTSPLLLQTTRLSIVTQLADTIANGLIFSMAPSLLKSQLQVAFLNPVKLAHNLIN